MFFLWPRAWDAAAEEPEVALLFEARARREIRVASNFPYEVWLDGAFAGDGGHRCVPGEALLDAWDARAADRVVLRLHWMDPARTVVYGRRLFADPFLAVEDEDWTCSIDRSTSFGAKACGQLPRQTRVAGMPAPGRPLVLGAAPLAHAWRCVPGGIARSRVVPAERISIRTDAAAGPPRAPRLGEVGADLAEEVVAGLPAGLACTTLDLGRIALHRFEVEGDGPCLLVHAEVPDLAGTWGTAHRKKTRLVDAVDGGGAPLGWRGGRYVHVVHEPGRPPSVRAWRREYPLRWRDLPPPADPRDATILEACRNNLVACVDGGLVDTCWRERAQWTGDLRMSAMAVRALATSDEVVGLALRQVAASYDPAVGMVQAVWPASAPRDVWIPGYHPAFCLAAIEHGLDREPAAARVVRESLPLWRARFVEGGLLRRGFPEGAWWFVDWDPATRGGPHDAAGAPGPDAVTNAFFHEACSRIGLPSIDPAAFDDAYWTGRAYRLVPGGAESPQATAAAVLAFPDSARAAAAVEWLLEEHRGGRIAERVTPYFAWFVARAIGTRSREAMSGFVREHYGPVAARLGTIPERTNEDASLAHGWSVGVAAILAP